MRKRSEVKPSAEERTVLMFEDEEASRKSAFTKEDSGSLPKFLKCPKCGLNQSEGSAKTNGKGFACMSCGTALLGLGTGKDDGPQPDVKLGEDGPVECCETCGVPLTVTSLGKFHPCACASKKAREAPKKEARPLNEGIEKLSASKEELEREFADEGDTVNVTWGEEKFTPIPNSYSTFTVGPFSSTTRVRAGETHKQARERVAEDLRVQAEEERDRKCKSFVDALKRMMNEARR